MKLSPGTLKVTNGILTDEVEMVNSLHYKNPIMEICFQYEYEGSIIEDLSIPVKHCDYHSFPSFHVICVGGIALFQVRHSQVFVSHPVFPVSQRSRRVRVSLVETFCPLTLYMFSTKESRAQRTDPDELSYSLKALRYVLSSFNFDCFVCAFAPIID